MADNHQLQWDRRRDSNESAHSQASSLPASINQRPRQPQDNYTLHQPTQSASGMVHRNPFQNPSPAPSINGDSGGPLQPPSMPFNYRPTSSSASSSKVDLSSGGASLSVQYLPSKFSRPVSPGVSYRKANKPGAPGVGLKRGGGTNAFGASSRMPTGPGKLRWNRFKWILLFTNTILTLYSLGALLFTLLIWFNFWGDSQIIITGNRSELSASTFAACACLLTSLFGWSGLLLNNRMFLGIYTLCLWVSFVLLCAPGYATYKKRTFNLEGKINAQWSRGLNSSARLTIQNALQCCGYFSPYVEATLSAKCYSRSQLPGCKGPYFYLEKDILQKWYIITFSIVPLHLMCMVAAILCSNHVTYRFGKGMTPKAYRLNAEAMAVIMDTYASQLAEQYADDASEQPKENARSRSTMALIDTLGYYMNAGNGTGSRDSSQSGHEPSGQPGYYYGSNNNYGSTTGLVRDGSPAREGGGGGFGNGGYPNGQGGYPSNGPTVQQPAPRRAKMI